MRRSPLVLTALAAAGPPDAGTVAGPEAALFDRRPARTRVPKRDTTPPLALLRLEPETAPPVIRSSPKAEQEGEPVVLARPSLAATALVRDAEATNAHGLESISDPVRFTWN